MGIALLKTASGMDIAGLNASRNAQRSIHAAIHALRQPIAVRQLMLHMLAYRESERIPTVSMFRNLRCIMKNLESFFRFFRHDIQLQRRTSISRHED